MKTPLLSSLLSFALALRMSAAMVVEYPFPPVVSNGTPVIHDSNLTASNPTWVGVVPVAGFGGTAGNAHLSSVNKITSFAADKYLTFTIAAKEGYRIQLDSFAFDLGGTTPASPLTVYAEVRSSVDGFASSLPIGNGNATVASEVVVPGNSTPVYSSFSITLGNEFQNLESVTFRIHIYMNTTATNAFLRMDNFQLEGSTQAIPEPSSVSILGAAIVGLLVVARRRSQRPV